MEGGRCLKGTMLFFSDYGFLVKILAERVTSGLASCRETPSEGACETVAILKL